MKIKYYITFKLIEIFPRIFENLLNALYRQKLSHSLKYLMKNKIKIDTVYDIGAYKGHWTLFLNKTSLKKSNFYLFEANIENEKFLKNLNYKYFISVLSDVEKKVKFYSKVWGGDSYYLENSNFYDKNLDDKEVTTTTLDKIVKENDIPLPDFIKIDTQGSEIDILKGGNTILKNCSIIYLECPIIEYNLGAPNFTEYVNYMKTIDYTPYEICEVHNVDKALVQVDILFLKTSILKKINHNKKILNIFN
jgi:FkbM family methyltransferase